MFPMVNDSDSKALTVRKIISTWAPDYTDFGACGTITVICAIIVVIVFGNTLTITAVLKERRLHQVQNWFIVSLACADLLVGLTVMPLTLTYEVLGRWTLGSVICELWLALDVLFVTSSILNICVISLDRYWSVTDPINYVRKRTQTRVLLMIASAWAIALLISFPPLVGWRPDRSDTSTCDLSTRIDYVLYSSMGSFYIPSLVLIVAYVKIFQVTRQRARKLSQSCRTDHEVTPRFVTARVAPTLLLHCSVAAVSLNERTTSPSPCPSPSKRCSLPYELAQLKAAVSNGAGRNHHPHHHCGCSLLNKLAAQLGCCCSSINRPHDRHRTQPIIVQSCGCPQQIVAKSTSRNNRCIVATCEQVSPINSDSETSGDHKTPLVLPFDSVVRTYCCCYCLQIPATMTTKTTLKSPQNQVGTVRQRQQLVKRREMKATAILGFILFGFIFCWLPFFLIYVLNAVCCSASELVFDVFFWLGYCNSALNPIIYAVVNIEFRNAFNKLLGCRSNTLALAAR